MMIPKGFYYCWMHPEHGVDVHFVLRALTKREHLILRLPNPKSCARMTNFYVAPKLRRAGFGSRLLKELADWCWETSSNVTFRAAPYASRPGLKGQQLHDFYSARGFHQIEGTHQHYRSWANG